MFPRSRLSAFFSTSPSLLSDLSKIKRALVNDHHASDNEKAFGLIDAILNKDTGVLGKQGIGMLFNDKSLQGDNMKTKRLTVEYIINVTRDQLSKSLKYDQKKNQIKATFYYSHSGCFHLL